jgi:putative ABC transport system substrate-binding protein
MTRVLSLVTLILSLLAASLAAEAQLQPKIPRIGVVAGGFPTDDACVEALRRGIHDLGYVEGQTHVLELRWSEGRVEPFPSLAADLVRLKMDLIVSTAAPAAEAVKKATASIPIVLASSFYPVEIGVIESLAHPGGNVTGVTHFTPELMAKRVQLLKEALPRLSRVAVLRLSGHIQDLVVRDMETAARQLGVELQVIEVRSVEDLTAAFDTAMKSRAQAVMSTQGPFFNLNSTVVAQLALKHRLPTLSGEPTTPGTGILLFYGPNVIEGCYRAAYYVDRILKGARPADLPVEQPTKIKVVINLKTARALRLMIPPSVLAGRMR